MKRGAPLKRTPFRRKEGPTSAREAKPRARAEVKTKTCTAPKCGREFVPARPLQAVCSTLCAARKVKADNEAQARRAREEFKRRKEAIKTIPQLEAECRSIVQKIARIRDRNDGCISCHMGPNYGGQWHGSHFRSVGACSALQFHLWNIHKSCAQCNLHKSGNIAAYRPRLIEKIGADRVAWLEAQNGTVKHTPEYREYLGRFKRVMGKRLRRMERRHAMQG
jgi:hypothetical protein